VLHYGAVCCSVLQCVAVCCYLATRCVDSRSCTHMSAHLYNQICSFQIDVLNCCILYCCITQRTLTKYISGLCVCVQGANVACDNGP